MPHSEYLVARRPDVVFVRDRSAFYIYVVPPLRPLRGRQQRLAVNIAPLCHDLPHPQPLLPRSRRAVSVVMLLHRRV
jgi:hypothetical protein